MTFSNPTYPTSKQLSNNPEQLEFDRKLWGFYLNDPWDSHGFLLPGLSFLLCSLVVCSPMM